jgi:NADH-quinone oxidoreductase chain 15
MLEVFCCPRGLAFRGTMRPMSDLGIYDRWLEVMAWMKSWADAKGYRFDKESDFTQYIYRMDRDYNLPTTVQAVSIGLPDGKAVIVASVSPAHEPLKGIELRLLGGHSHWHLHEHDGHLLEGKRPFTEARLQKILEGIFSAVTV